jgi:hypothetical protein
VLAFDDAEVARSTVAQIRRDGGIFDDEGGGYWFAACTVVNAVGTADEGKQS